MSKMCLVSFFIVKAYKDEVWFHVTLMDTCHLLLDRPWHYDMGMMYDELKQTYSFMACGKKVVLTPLKPVTEARPVKKEVSSLMSYGKCKKKLAK